MFSLAKATKFAKHRDCEFAAASLQDDQNKPLIEWVSSFKWLKSHADLCYKYKMRNSKCNELVFDFHLISEIFQNCTMIKTKNHITKIYFFISNLKSQAVF